MSTMHSTHTVCAIATAEHYCYLEHQDLQVATASKQIKTPQRKAKYSDKERIRLKDAKKWALVATGCFSTVEVKYWLKKLGIKLDLRLTAAWIAVWKELATIIKSISKAHTTSVPPKPIGFAPATIDIYLNKRPNPQLTAPKQERRLFSSFNL